MTRQTTTLNSVAAALWDGFKSNGVWPAQRTIATRFHVSQDTINGIVAALERKGAVPPKHERQRHNNNVSARSANKRLRAKKAGAKRDDDLMSDSELAVLYAGRRYYDDPKAISRWR